MIDVVDGVMDDLINLPFIYRRIYKVLLLVEILCLWK